MKNTKLYAGIIVFFAFVSGATFAGDEGVAVARLGENGHPGIKNRIDVPSVTEHYEYYEISGDSEGELRNQLCRKGCVLDSGEKYDSVTRWRWTLNYGYDRTPQTCSVDSFRVDLSIQYRYPRWVPSDGVSPSLVGKWKGYLKNLVAHETGHRDLAVTAAVELSRAVSTLPPARSCSELDREIQALGHERMQQLNTDERNYDAMTEHGKKQGAMFL